MFIQLEVNLGDGTHWWEKRKPIKTTDCLLHSPGSLVKRVWRKSKVTCRNQERYTSRLIGNALKTPCIYWIHQARAQEKNVTFWQTKSHAIIAYKTVPPDCIERVTSQKDATTLNERHSTPRPAPRIIFKNAENPAAAAGWLGKLRETATITVLWEKKTRFKSIFELMECYTRRHLKGQGADDQDTDICG